jgi:uncharacterized protein DUF6551
VTAKVVTKRTIETGLNTLEDKAEIRTFPVKDLLVDKRVQRPYLNTAKIDRMVAGFNPDALGIGTVSDRGNGEIVVLDGMHRREVIALVTDNQGTFDCRVFTGLSLEQEADIFLLLNSGTQPSLATKYQVGVIGNVEDLVTIDKTVHAFGLTVGEKIQNGTINAIASLQRIHEMDAKLDEKPLEGNSYLARTLRVLTRAWGNDRRAFLAPMLMGVAKVLEKYPSLEEDRLVEQLAQCNGGPGGLLARGKGLASIRNIRPQHAVGQCIVDEYNAGLGSNSARVLRNFTK